jgi:GAF domain-containing protein
MKIRGEVIGVLNLKLDSDRVPSDTNAVVEEIANRLSLILENARLVDSAQRRAEREQLIGDITAKIRETLDMDTVIRTAVEELSNNLGLNEVEIRIGSTASLLSSSPSSVSGNGQSTPNETGEQSNGKK